MIDLHLAATPNRVYAKPEGYDEACRAQMLGMPGVTWDRTKRCYVGAPEAMLIAITLLESAGVVRVVGARETAAPSGVAPAPYHVSHDTQPALRDYQRHGVGWLVATLRATGGALLADDMGLGKTLQAIIAADIVAAGKHRVVVCPAIAAPHWRKQIALWGDPSATWHIFSYTGFRLAMAKGHGPLFSFSTPALIILDEGHALCNPKAKQTAAVREYIESVTQPNRPMVLGLTGTPMTARVSDMWSLLDILHPGRWGTKWQFEKRYADGRYEEIKAIAKSVWKADGATHLAELNHRLQHVMLRRLKADVAAELPPRTRVMLDVEMPRAASRFAKQVKKRMVADAAGAPDSELAAHTLRANGLGDLLAAAEEFKVEAAIELARDVIAAGHRPLVLTLRKATAAVIGQALMAPVVDGEVPAAERRERLLSGGAGVATLYSVTTAIDLVEFDTLIFVGLDWVPSNIQQGEARIHRIGSDRPVTIYYLIGIGTVDELVRERVIDRLGTFAAAVGDASGDMASTLKGGTEDELLAALAQAVMAQ